MSTSTNHPLCQIITYTGWYDTCWGLDLVSKIDGEFRGKSREEIAVLVNDVLDEEGRTALHCMTAVPHQYPDVVVAHLLRAGAKVDAQDGKGMTALCYACSNSRSGHSHLRNARVVQVLIEAGANVNDFPDPTSGMSPLHFACDWDNEESASVVRQLLRAGANVNALDKTGSTALHYSRRDLELAQMLEEAGADVDLPNTTQGDTPLHCCLFIRERCSIHGNQNRWEGEDPHFPLDSGHLAAFLIQKGANVLRPNKRGNRPADCIQKALEYAIYDEDHCPGFVSSELCKIIDFLKVVVPPILATLDEGSSSQLLSSSGEQLDRGTIGGKMMFRVVDEFCGDCGEDIMEHIYELMDLGADVNYANPNKHNFTLLHLLLSPWEQKRELREDIHVGDVIHNILEEARQQGQQFDFSARATHGRTLLHIASQCQWYGQIVEQLVELAPFLLEERTTDADMQNTPLHIAVMENAYCLEEEEWSPFDTLLRLGADVTATTAGTHNYTPLHLACQHSFEGYLLETLFDRAPHLLNATDTSGKTALHHAAARRQCEHRHDLVEQILTFLKSSESDGEKQVPSVALADEVNRCDENGQTPLHIVCMNRHRRDSVTGKVATLLDHHADPLIMDKFGMLPIQWALLARKNCRDCPNLVYTLLSRQQAWNNSTAGRNRPGQDVEGSRQNQGS